MEERIGDSAVSIREISLPIFQSKGWIKFIGILSIIQGIVAALTLVGLIIAWLPIWIGVLLMQSASAIERARIRGDKASLLSSLEKLRTYFTIQGILTLLTLIAAAIAFAMGVLGAIFGVLSRLR
jgi:hypothetical protein